MDAPTVACIVLALVVFVLLALLLRLEHIHMEERRALLRAQVPGFVIEDHRPDVTRVYGTDEDEYDIEQRRRKGAGYEE